MSYRDLVVDRLGGKLIASQIRIAEGGPVADYVHYHELEFQLIYCITGWVRVVYEDQGPAFVIRPGDAVLQPPKIRHRVLECAPGTEVVEIGSPAEHVTRVDHELALPTPVLAPEREFCGQRFVRHELATATWGPWRLAGFEARDLGIFAATRGRATAHVVRRVAAAPFESCRHDAGQLLLCVLGGELTLADGRQLAAGDACALPEGASFRFAACTDALELLELVLF
jgi:quercetin dioxygenase-like cupin family protein